MKLGAENRTKTLWAAGLFVVAIALLVRTFVFGPSASANSSTPKNPVADILQGPTTQPPARRSGGRRRSTPPKLAKDAAEQQQTIATLDPRLQLGMLKSTENVEYKGAGRNIFRAEAEPVIPDVYTPPKDVGKVTPPPPPQPPPPQPINLKFFGFASKPGEAKSIFLSQGEDVWVAKEGEIVNRRYKILKILPNAVDVQDMLTNNRQSIPLTQG